jgi:Zn-dependent alcohol dehydrogenase
VKAAVCREFGAPLVIEEVTLGRPGPEDVHVRLSAVAICHSDITYIDGGWGGTLPAIFGHEAAGIVVECGEAVAEVNAGARVLVTLLRSCGSCFYCDQQQPSLCESRFALDEKSPLTDQKGATISQGLKTAAFAEEVVVHRSQVIEIPTSIPFDSASLLSCGVITGVGAVRNVAQVVNGASVVTIGAGGVGMNCIQGASLSYAEPNIAIDLSDKKLNLAWQFGATHTINSKVQNIKTSVMQLTQGRGTDYVFVATGSGSAIEQAVQLTRRGGKVILVGMTGEGVRVKLDTLNLTNDAIQLLGSKMGATRLQSDIPILVSYYLDGRLKLDELISGRFCLRKINEAIEEVKTGSKIRNVIML